MSKTKNLPDIPEKRYFTIGEVANLLDIKPHVLRYWEHEFQQLNPIRREKRRYYRRDDVVLIFQIKTLLHDDGFTIEGARGQLKLDKKPMELIKTVQSRKSDAKALKEIADDLQSIITQLQETV